MKKQTQSFIIGAMLGIGLATTGMLGVFFATTVSYKSTLFPSKHVRLVAHRFHR